MDTVTYYIPTHTYLHHTQSLSPGCDWRTVITSRRGVDLYQPGIVLVIHLPERRERGGEERERRGRTKRRKIGGRDGERIAREENRLRI
jgi:hypothetical protein